MNKDDKKLYIRLFIDFVKDGQLIKPEDKDVDYILTKIPNSYLEQFDYWLRAKSNEIEDEDDFYKWYDNITFDDLTEDEIHKYYLPSKKKTIYYNWETELALSIYKLAKDFVDEAKKLPLYESNIVVGYKFDNYGMDVFYYAPKGKQLPKSCLKNGYDLKVRKQVYELYKKFFAGSNGQDSYSGEAQILIKKKFKPQMEAENIFIGENTSEVSSKASETDADYYTGRWWGISCYEVNAQDDFSHRFFEYVADSYESKARPDEK